MLPLQLTQFEEKQPAFAIFSNTSHDACLQHHFKGIATKQFDLSPAFAHLLHHRQELPTPLRIDLPDLAQIQTQARRFLQSLTDRVESSSILSDQFATKQQTSRCNIRACRPPRFIQPSRRRFLEAAGIIDLESLERRFVARQSIQIKKHQPQTFARAVGMLSDRIFQNRPHRIILPVGVQHRRLFGIGVDRINLCLNMKTWQRLAKDKVRETRSRRLRRPCWRGLALRARRFRRNHGAFRRVFCPRNHRWLGHHFFRRFLEKGEDHKPIDSSARTASASNGYF